MIITDANRILELVHQIQTLERRIEAIAQTSEIATRIRTITGCGPICSATAAGEIGTLHRFGSESSLALYAGWRGSTMTPANTARQNCLSHTLRAPKIHSAVGFGQ